MKTVEEFKEFYEHELIKDLQEVEKKRKCVIQRVKLMSFLSILLTFFVLYTIFLLKGENFGVIVWPFLIWFYLYFYISKNYVNEFKEIIISKIVSFIDSNLVYSPNGCVSEGEFILSNLFKITKDTSFISRDKISGKIDSTPFMLSNFTALRGHEKDARAFSNGMFFVAHFNKNFHDVTIVLPDKAEKLFGFFGSSIQSLNSGKGELIKLEDSEFEKYFVVYGDSQVTARYVLSTTLMQRISEFVDKFKVIPSLSFVNSKVYIFIPGYKDMLRPKVLSTMVSFDEVERYYEHLKLVIGIVEDLNLNTRIWSEGAI